MASLVDRLWAEVESYVDAEHIELDDLEVLGEGPSRIIRITLDGEALGVDRIADIARGLSRIFDDLDPFDGAYTLEVTSPGLERKLRRPRHFEKAVGSEIKVKTFGPLDGERTHSGTLVAATDTSFTVDVDETQREIPYDAVASARTVFVWVKADKPGSRS